MLFGLNLFLHIIVYVTLPLIALNYFPEVSCLLKIVSEIREQDTYRTYILEYKFYYREACEARLSILNGCEGSAGATVKLRR